eukprot:TRINITY_DN7055_c0_g1_i1.p1 TRINITY_DN7055_c0_g1~~TRINITY_DN7055_c0_g1_i1.p1  ORF type:complete len:572 (-),score=134.08 TRINITY_DN7055_c0_g1_i1:22-1737(-)
MDSIMNEYGQGKPSEDIIQEQTAGNNAANNPTNTTPVQATSSTTTTTNEETNGTQQPPTKNVDRQFELSYIFNTVVIPSKKEVESVPPGTWVEVEEKEIIESKKAKKTKSYPISSSDSSPSSNFDSDFSSSESESEDNNKSDGNSSLWSSSGSSPISAILSDFSDSGKEDKENTTRNRNNDFDDMGDDFDDRKSKKKVQEYMEVPEPVDIMILPTHTLVPIGDIAHVIDNLLVINSTRSSTTLDLNSILCLGDRTVVGRVEEVFGPVKEPFYSVRFPNPIDTEKFFKGKTVFFVPDFVKFVVEAEVYTKGCDASGDNDLELPPEEIEFSDDEKEAQAKALKKQKNKIEKQKRQQYSETGPPHPGENQQTPTFRSFPPKPHPPKPHFKRNPHQQRQQRQPNHQAPLPHSIPQYSQSINNSAPQNTPNYMSFGVMQQPQSHSMSMSMHHQSYYPSSVSPQSYPTQYNTFDTSQQNTMQQFQQFQQFQQYQQNYYSNSAAVGQGYQQQYNPYGVQQQVSPTFQQYQMPYQSVPSVQGGVQSAPGMYSQGQLYSTTATYQTGPKKKNKYKKRGFN